MMLGEVSGRMMPHASARQLVGYEGRQRSILLVEDDSDQREFLQQLLTSLDFQCLGLIRMARRHRSIADKEIDLAILDISLPGISGWEDWRRPARSLWQQVPDTDALCQQRRASSPRISMRQRDDRFLVKPVELRNCSQTRSAELARPRLAPWR